MHALIAISLYYATASLAAGHMRHMSFRKLTSHLLHRREDCGPGDTCAEACGPGWITCAKPGYCYNPATMVCCSNGYHCDKGYYCTDGFSCCPNGETLEECGANSVVPTIPANSAPPASSSAPPASSSHVPSSSSSSFPPFSSTNVICTEVPEPVTCERSCGPGYKICQRLPHCYNPGLGQECCPDGKYCPKGYYCDGTGGCCPNGRECHGSVSHSFSAVPSSNAPFASASSASVAVVPHVSGSGVPHSSHGSGLGPSASSQAPGGGTPSSNPPSASSTPVAQSSALAARGLGMEAVGVALAGLGVFFL